MQIVEPVKSPAPTSPTATPAESAPKTSWRYVNNINPDQQLHFTDGTSVVFQNGEYVTNDAELAKKIEKVMARYRICHG